VPAPANFAVADEEAAAELLQRRIALHNLGFVEVLRLHRRRHGDVTEVLDASYTTPDPTRPRLVGAAEADVLRAPRCAWLVANRIPRHDRA
jgi:hypothetical protein